MCRAWGKEFLSNFSVIYLPKYDHHILEAFDECLITMLTLSWAETLASSVALEFRRNTELVNINVIDFWHFETDVCGNPGRLTHGVETISCSNHNAASPNTDHSKH